MRRTLSANCFPATFELQKRKKKNGNENWNSVFQCLGKRKMDIEVRIPFFNIVGKRKTKMEVLIPFSEELGKRKTKMEV